MANAFRQSHNARAPSPRSAGAVPKATGSRGESVLVAGRLKSIAPFRVMELMKRAAQLEAEGHRVVHFEVGEPDFNTAEPIVEAGRRALLEGHTKYTHALGTEALREALSRDYQERLGVAIPAERILVTAGASGGLLLLNALLIDPGRRPAGHRSRLSLQCGLSAHCRRRSPARAIACGARVPASGGRFWRRLGAPTRPACCSLRRPTPRALSWMARG